VLIKAFAYFHCRKPLQNEHEGGVEVNSFQVQSWTVVGIIDLFFIYR